MAHKRVSAASGQPFNIPENIVETSVSGSWGAIGDAVQGRAVRVQGVYWSTEVSGAKLQIRDRIRYAGGSSIPGAIWYEADCLGPCPAVDLFPAHLTLFAPFEYFSTDTYGDTIVIYGEFV